MRKTSFILILSILCLTLQAQKYPFQLIELPYSTDALAPVISQKTIEYHHGKHLNGYVNNLNRLVKDTDYEKMSLKDIIRQSKEGSVFNNAGQTLNHNLYFLQFSPYGGGAPQAELGKAIIKEWGSFDNFKKEFVERGNALFGAGWIWLAKDDKDSLFITEEANGSNPIAHGLTPLLGVDLWEHAYYLDYQNRRSDHLNQLWNIINWKVIEERYHQP